MGSENRQSVPSDPDNPENNETRASLELLYNVSREFASALDLKVVLQRVLLLSMQTVGANSGSIIVVNENGEPLESAIVTGTTIHDHTTHRLRETLERGLAGWVLRNQQAVLIENTSLDERWMARKYEDGIASEAKSVISAPILARNQLVGIITLAKKDIHTLSIDHLDLVKAIADQAGIAILNARLYSESLRQAHVMTALADSAAAITASVNLEEVLNRILEQIAQALNVRAVSLAMVDPQSAELIFRATLGWESTFIPNLRTPVGISIAGWVAREGQGVVVNNVNSDPRYDPETSKRTGMKVTEVASVPIFAQEQVIGVLEALNPLEGMFDPDALSVLTGIGSLAATAIQHAQLFERLQAAHQRYRELFEGSVDPVIITSTDGSILEANRQALLASKYQREALKGAHISKIHKIEAELATGNLSRLASGEALYYESMLVTKDLLEVPVEVHAQLAEIEDVPHIQWIFRDITERKRLDTIREDMLSMIIHDLQSPLANVLTSLELVREDMRKQSDPTTEYLINLALRSSYRTQRLIQSLLDINRLEAGQRIGKREEVNPNTLIEEIIEILRPTTDAKNQQLCKDIPSPLPPVWIDEDMIRRVILNLAENASKYTPAGSQITIGGTHDYDKISLWVQDNGPGIPPQDHERIFQKFSRVNQENSPKGSGIGLAFCKLAIDAHGGRIWIESNLGEGARFIFTLPLEPFEGGN